MSMAKKTIRSLMPKQADTLMEVLKTRFEKNMHRHKGISWNKLADELDSQADKLWSLHEMERTGGEPDVVGFDEKKKAYIFFDCAPESPKGRRSICYDREGLESRKENRPEDTALDMAADMGIKILSEAEYRMLQELGEFDLKTSSWLETPTEIRKLGGAIFGDRRHDHVFIYHNGAQSYYAARGFRGSLLV